MALLLLMPVMWVVSSLLLWWSLPLSFWAAMMTGAIVTPTDPIVASSIVSGETARTHVPGRVRHLLSAESGFNDGLAYPFVFLGILMLQKSPSSALEELLTRVVLWEIGGAALFGAITGIVAGKVLLYTRRKQMIENESVLAYSISLSLIALGGGKLLGTDGILVVFVAGICYAMIIKKEIQNNQERIQESINTFFTLPSFFLLGTVLPWQDWIDLGIGKLCIVAIAILIVRRLPFVFLFSFVFKPIRGNRDKIFYGWFGPAGISALFYASLAFRELEGNSNARAAWAIGTLVITVSIIVHGISATPLTEKLYVPRSEEETEKDYR